MNQNIAPTSEFLAAILWLGGTSRSGDDVPIGSGVVVHHEDQEYLATALHVARSLRLSTLYQALWFMVSA